MRVLVQIAEGDALWVARCLGAAAGALISLVYLLPKGRREAAGRFSAVRPGLHFPTGWRSARGWGRVEITLMGSAAASLCAWWALGVLTRMAERWAR